MGLGYSVWCTICFYRKDFFTGSGMLHSNLERCLGSFSSKTRMKIEEAIGDQKVTDFQFYNVLVHCNHCHSLACRPWIAIQYGDGQHYETTFRCSKCKKPMSAIDPLEVKFVPCPSCKAVKLQSEQTILWD